jgi:hypothetical protein
MKKVDRQPDRKPAEPYAGGHDTERANPEAARTGAQDKGKRSRRPEDPGLPVDKEAPESEPRFPEKDGFDKKAFEDERSDRASGRPLQLEDEDSGEAPAGRPAAEAGRGGQQGPTRR